MVIRETLKRNDDACGDDVIPAAYTRTWRGSWIWDAGAARFKGQTIELDRLDRLNEARF